MKKVKSIWGVICLGIGAILICIGIMICTNSYKLSEVAEKARDAYDYARLQFVS